METHALSVNICKEEYAPYLQLNKFHVPGESLMLCPRAVLQGWVFKCCAWESDALKSYKVHQNGRNFGFCLSLRLVDVAAAELLAWEALGLADC